MKKIDDKIKSFKEEYSHPDDVSAADSKVQEWRNKIAKAGILSKYYDLEMSKDIAKYLKDTIKNIRLKILNTEGLDEKDNLALHARRKECEGLLAFFTKNPEKEIEAVENEVDSMLS